MVTRSIENAQKRVEGHNFDIRKNLIEYDDVMNLQRKAIYSLRRKVLGDDPMIEDVLDMIERVVSTLCTQNCPPRSSPDEWDVETLKRRVKGVFGFEPDLSELPTRYSDLELEVYEQAEARLRKKQELLGRDFVVVKDGLISKENLQATDEVVEPVWRYLLRQFYLGQIDRHWRDHLTQMDHLREGIGLRGYGSRDPKIEYKREAHQLFNSLTREVDFNVCAELFNVQLMSPEEARAQQERQRRAAEQMARMAQMRGAGSGGSDQADSVRPAAAAAKKPGNADRLVKGRPRYRKTSKKEKRAKRR
jgi:preprotein translocase subunit SecA